MKKISDLVVNKPKLIVLISLLLLIPATISYIFTNVNYDILSYLPSKLDSVKGENILEEDFGGGSMTIVLVKTVDDNGGKISPNTVMKLKNNISEIKNVSNVLWADNIMDTSVPGDILPDDVKNVFYSSDGEYTMMFVSYSEDASSKDIIKSVKEIKKILPENCYLSGISAMNSDTKEMTDRETPIYILIAVALAIITMMITMESYVMPFILVGVIGIAVMYNMGTNFFMGVSYITQSIAAILQLGVTIDYSIFLVNRYNEERKYSRTKEEAMARALHGSFISLSGSSLTTLFGFLALCFMQLTLGLNIGIVMAKGVIIGVLSVVIILPAFMLVFDSAINRHRHKPFTPDFGKLVNHIIKRKKAFAALFIIIIIPSLLLSANVKKNYNLNAELPDDATTTVGTALLKEKFNMTTSHFIIVDDSIPASKLVRMENEISNVEGVSSMLAYDMFVGTSIPDSIVPDDVIDIVKQNGRQVMLVNSIYESSTDKCNEQVEKIENIVQKYTGSEHYGYVTGEGALYKDLIETTKVDFAVTSLISIIAVFIVIAIVFKSISIPFILIIAIEVAIWINQGISTLFGTAIPFIAPTVISCIQLGATVDYAILLTSRFKEELAKGAGRTAAMRKAANEAIRSVFQSAMLFFFATFGVYLVCSISIVKSLCAMLARGSLISALVIVLFVTPILLLCEKLISKTTKGWGTHDDKPEPEPVAQAAVKKNIDEYEFEEETSFTFTDDGEDE
mgnify:FL=1